MIRWMLDVPSCSILSVFSMLIERLDSNQEVNWRVYFGVQAGLHRLQLSLTPFDTN